MPAGGEGRRYEKCGKELKKKKSTFLVGNH
jgi:hypothetical protein